MQFARLWSLNNDITTSIGLPHALNFPKPHPHLHQQNSIRVHPYAPPQHIKVLKHFVYICYGCGMQFARLWSLNHDLTTSIGLCNALNFPKPHPHLHRWNSVRMHPCAHPQQITAYQGAAITLCIYMIWIWGAVCKALEPQP